jgi:hypothetical protein
MRPLSIMNSAVLDGPKLHCRVPGATDIASCHAGYRKVRPASTWPGCGSFALQVLVRGAQPEVSTRNLRTGVDGSRTHQGRFCSTPRTVLKTAEPTGTQPPPDMVIGYRLFTDWSNAALPLCAQPGVSASTWSWAPGCIRVQCPRTRDSRWVPSTRRSGRCRRTWLRPADPRSA